MNQKLTFAAALALLGLMALATGCGGSKEPSPTPTTTAASSSTPAPEQTPAEFKVKSIEAARQYLASTGIHGKKGDLTDPFDCARLPATGASGAFCIVDGASVYAPGLAIIYVANPKKQKTEVWEMRLKPGSQGWEVTEVRDVPSGQ
jgi:hypothetical protein